MGFRRRKDDEQNPTLETSTFSGMTLGSPEGLTVVSVDVTPASKEGHGSHGAAPGSAPHAEHEVVPSPAETEPEPSTFEVEPVPVEGFVFEPDAHIDIVVKVALEESADRGTAENVAVQFNSPARECSVAHPLTITVNRTSCSP